jgi:hypothetical protein
MLSWRTCRYRIEVGRQCCAVGWVAWLVAQLALLPLKAVGVCVPHTTCGKDVSGDKETYGTNTCMSVPACCQLGPTEQVGSWQLMTYPPLSTQQVRLGSTSGIAVNM